MNNAGRIGFLIKGEYSAAPTYDFLDVVFYNGASYVAKKLTAGNTPVRSNEYWQIFAEGTMISDVSNATITFEQAENRVNVASGEDVATFAGKIKKWFSDLKPVAFFNPTNNLLANVAGTALDAVQGKVLDDKIIEVKSNLDNLFGLDSNGNPEELKCGSTTETDILSVFGTMGENTFWIGFLGNGSTKSFCIIARQSSNDRGCALLMGTHTARIRYCWINNGAISGLYEINKTEVS